MLGGFFDFSTFMPHGHCFWWQPEILWPTVVGDALTVVAYFSIPVLLLVFCRKRRDLPYPWMFVMFSSFILWCGITHLLGIWSIWVPLYPWVAVAKVLTGVVSVATAVALYFLIPKALQLRGPRELEEVNARLQEEVATCQALEAELKKTNLHLEETVAQRTEKLRRVSEEMEQFAYVASHDLQEPLRMVTNYCELLEEELNDQLGEDQRAYLKFAVDGAVRMKDLIDDLLSLSRAGRQTENDSRDPLPSVLEAEKLLHASIAEAGAALEVHPLPKVKVSHADLVSLFQNLLSNALKYRRLDAPLKIRVQGESDGDGSARFVVEDNGIGIEEKYFQRIFKVFERLHSRSEYPGTGMGLAICKKIVESLGGRIWVESTPGRGTRFVFTLPT